MPPKGAAARFVTLPDKDFRRVIRFIFRFSRDDRGATAIEYGLIAAITALVIIAAVTSLSSAISAKFTFISNALTAG
ncbi:hypothetical protein BH10PSE2_BH10PSE2_13910 [soil metagenome]